MVCLCWAVLPASSARLPSPNCASSAHLGIELWTLRASSGFAYGSQQEFCHCPWWFLVKGSVCCALCPSHLCCPHHRLGGAMCAGRVFPGDRLTINPVSAFSSCACIYRQKEAEFIQGNSCFSHLWNLNALLQQVSSVRWCFTATVGDSRMLSWGSVSYLTAWWGSAEIQFCVK